jgi:hypothetical protein
VAWASSLDERRSFLRIVLIEWILYRRLHLFGILYPTWARKLKIVVVEAVN